MYIADPAQTKSIIKAEIISSERSTGIEADFTKVESEFAGFPQFFRLYK